MDYVNLDSDWLEKQIRITQEEVRSWPEWFRRDQISMRELTSHKLPGLNDCLKIEVLDEPGPGNANHKYRITMMPAVGPEGYFTAFFQNGPILEAGVNGISNEALLAIVEDRLKGFQAGDYACRENAIALTHIQDALHWLQHRTRERLSRGVEGTTIQ